MKIILTRDDVMKILCAHFSIRHDEILEPTPRPISKRPMAIQPNGFDEVYWEGNPEKERVEIKLVRTRSPVKKKN